MITELASKTNFSHKSRNARIVHYILIKLSVWRAPTEIKRWMLFNEKQYTHPSYMAINKHPHTMTHNLFNANFIPTNYKVTMKYNILVSSNLITVFFC